MLVEYLGNDEYSCHLESGKLVSLTKDEIVEIAEIATFITPNETSQKNKLEL